MWGLIRKDLGEFVSTLKDDAAVTIKSAMTLGEGGEEYESSYEGSEDSESEDRRSQPPHQQRQHQATAALRAIRADIKTYTEDIPEAQSERFSAFLERFDLGARTKDIATLLQEEPVVTKIHTQLVPEHLTYDDFWARYFFRAEGVAQGNAGGGISFPQDDDDDDEDFGWGEDEQEEDADATTTNNNSAPILSESRPAPSPPHDNPSPQRDNDPPAARAGGALGAMRTAELRASPEEPVSLPVPGLSSSSSTDGGGVKSLASAAAMAEIARLTAALRESEEKRASLAGGGERPPSSSGLRGDGEAGEVERQRDAAVAEANDLRSKLLQLETQHADTLAKSTASFERAAEETAAEYDRLQQLRGEEYEARIFEAEERARLQVAARAEAESAAAAAVASAANVVVAKNARGKGITLAALTAAEAAAEEAEGEVARLRKAFREERAENEARLLASRQAATEAVEAALNSADVDREEACAVVTASMKAEINRKDQELEALCLQLAKSEGALQEVSSLRADVEDLRRAVQGERDSAERAASEARQEADVVKQLREEIRVLRAASHRPGTSPAAATGRGGRTGASGRRSSGSRSDVAGGEDTDGWGEEEEDDSCAASSINTNHSSVVVVDRPSSSASLGGGGGGANGGTVGGGGGSAGGDESSVSPVGGRAGQAAQERGEGEGEGDDGWEGWD